MSGDFHQWPLLVKITSPVWFPVFILLATLSYLGGMLWGTINLFRGR